MKFLLIIILSIIMADSTTVHQDRILKIDKDGNIIGLPKEFGPAKFDLDRSYLRIKDKAIVLPKCVSYYFKIHDKPELNLSASWYHSKDIMPYYINFDISQKNKDSGYEILVDLETLELIHVQTSVKQGKSTDNHLIKVDDSCLDEYKKSIKTV